MVLSYPRDFTEKYSRLHHKALLPHLVLDSNLGPVFLMVPKVTYFSGFVLRQLARFSLKFINITFFCVLQHILQYISCVGGRRQERMAGAMLT